MGSETKIQWADKTWSPWRGCTKVAPGCTNCYAEAGSKRNQKVLGIWGDNGRRVVNANWDQVHAWNRKAEKDGKAITVFPSLCDPFEDWGKSMHNHLGVEIPDTMTEVRSQFFKLIRETPWVRWLIVTKRPENAPKMWPIRTLHAPDSLPHDEPRRLDNVVLVTSISEQETANRNIPLLLQCRDLCSAIGVSAEPLLGPIDLSYPEEINAAEMCCGGYECGCRGLPCNPPLTHYLDWVIVGGESRQHGECRPCQLRWIRSIVRQCEAANVACFVKQLGSEVFNAEAGDFDQTNEVWSLLLKHPKGGDPAEWPEDLRVHEFPKALAQEPIGGHA